VVVTSPSPPPLAFIDALAHADLTLPVIHAPLIHVTPLPAITLPAEAPDWVIWTSPRAVQAVMPHWLKATPPQWQAKVRHAALGHAEANALSAFDQTTHWQAPVAVGKTMFTDLAATLPPGQRLWWPTGNLADKSRAALLQPQHNVTVTEVYTTQTVAIDDAHPAWPYLTGDTPGVWVVTSPSGVHALAESLKRWNASKPDWPTHHTIAALGPTTAQAANTLLGVSALQPTQAGDWQNLAKLLVTVLA
jgi:uroporphyrinogen-III synthase